MTDRELMQMALDALEVVTARMLDCRDELVERGGRPQTNLKHQDLWDSAFEAYTKIALPAAKAIRARLVQPEQEPWGYISHKAWKMPVFVEADDLQAANLPFNNPDYTPVYKAPPQREYTAWNIKYNREPLPSDNPHEVVAVAKREWVGMTDEELSPIYAEYKSPRNIYLAIESALREKNT